jgi:homoserine/homoserine lactone efflux protein
MTAHSLALFLLISLLATITPGPATMYVASLGATSDRRVFLLGALGILSADTLYFLASVTGLGAVTLASPTAFFVIKIVGSAYIVYVGCRLLWSALYGRGIDDHADAIQKQRTAFLHGLLLHGANPKAILYFGAIVPQFVRSDEALTAQFAVLGAAHLLTACVVLLLYGFAGQRLRAWWKYPVVPRLVIGTTGAVLVASAVGLLLFDASRS